MTVISKIILPFFILLVIVYGVKKKTNIYESFLDGAKEGLVTSFNIFPSIIAMIFAVNIFLDSNILNYIVKNISFIKTNTFPIEVMPMAILRPISGTASLALVNSLLKSYGPDSLIGRLACIIQGCTDTTIYVIALYFGSIKISKIRHSIWVGLFADLIGIITAIIITNLFF